MSASFYRLNTETVRTVIKCNKQFVCFTSKANPFVRLGAGLPGHRAWC